MGEYKMGDALRGFINKSNLKNGIRAIQIEQLWEELMGKTIAKYTEKIEIIQHTLFIHTTVGPLKNELAYQKPQIIERVNEALGEKIITQVVIK
ncbi:MAG: Zn-ribbon-containing, RNA-binding protein and derivative [Chitinophagaceae bacterium]|nr:Zn-ribbon-containing, RNA-binding protein and derivative [Chitinophagaceae bacterium]